MSSFRSTKLKIAVGYSLLLAMLIFSLVFVYHEMENLSTADNLQDLKTDSLLLLLHEKDRNTIEMLRVLNEANDSLLSASEIEEIISEQDSVITRHRVQNRVITKRDTLVTKPKKKGFFKRLGEVFVPSKKELLCWLTLLLNLPPIRSLNRLLRRILSNTKYAWLPGKNESGQKKASAETVTHTSE